MAFWHHVLPPVLLPHDGPPVTAPGPEAPACSAKGCAAAPTWDLLWNNSRLHTPERRKIWLACDEHRPTLGDFLGSRGFLKDVLPHDPEREDPGPIRL